MKFKKLLITFILLLSFHGVAQKLELHFEHPVELNGQLDYTVKLEYFDHKEKLKKKEYLFLKNKQSVVYNFDQYFPVEAVVTFAFKKSTHTFPLLLRPKNVLKININQTIADSVKLLKHEDFFNEYFTIEGKDANLNKLIITYQNLGEVDDHIYSGFYRNYNSKDTTLIREKFTNITERQINNYDYRIEKLVLGNSKDALYFKNYKKDKQRLQVAYNALNSIQFNGRKFGMDSLKYYRLIDYLFDLNGNNHHVEEYFYRSNQVSLYDERISLHHFSAFSAPFEAFMNSAEFLVSPEWDSIFQELKSSDGSISKNTVNKMRQLEKSWPVNGEVRSVMMNDLFYNGVVFDNYYGDSLFIAYLSTLGLPSEVKLNILLSRLKNLETGGLQHVGSFTNSARVLPYKMSKARRNLYLKAFKKYDRKEYEDILDFNFNKSRRITDDGPVADSIRIMNSDLELYNFALPDPSQVTVLISFGETYYYSLARKLSYMQELKRQFGTRLNLVILIDWGRRENKNVVDAIMTAIEAEKIPVKACIMKSHLSTYFYNKNNLRFPSVFFIINQDGFLPIMHPKKSPYFTFKLSERITLDKVYYGENVQSRSKTYSPRKHEINTGTNADSTEFILSFTEEIEVLLGSKSNYLKDEFDVFLDNAFADGKGWYSIQNNGSVVLSKNNFRTVHSSKPVRWLIDSKQTRLRIFDAERPNTKIEHKFQINKENRVLMIDDSEYKILFYDEEYIILAQP